MDKKVSLKKKVVEGIDNFDIGETIGKLGCIVFGFFCLACVTIILILLVMQLASCITIAKESKEPTETTVFVANDTKQYLLIIDTHTGDTWLAYKTDDERIFKIEKIYTKNGEKINWRQVQTTAGESSITIP